MMSGPTAFRSTMPNNLASPQINEFKFFYHTQNDDNFYLVECKMLLQDYGSLDYYGYDHGYDHGFFCKCSDNPSTNYYYVMCKLLSHNSILNILNNQLLGMNIELTSSKRELLSINQKFNLEQDLKKYLSTHFVQPRTPERTNINHGCNTRTVSMSRGQTNFDNCFPQQNEVGRYTHNGINIQKQVDYNNNIVNNIPQNIHGKEIRQDYSNLFQENNGNYVTTTQAGFMPDFNHNQNDDNNVVVNGVDYVHRSQQQVDHSQTPHSQAFRRNSVMTTQATNINQNYNEYISRQDVIGIEDYAQITTNSQQQVDSNNISLRTPEREMSGSHENNVMSTQSDMIIDINQNSNDNGLQSDDFTSRQDDARSQ